MIHLILLRPEIPQNTGAIGRLCAYADCRLHLIRPYGFELTDSRLRRAGMDYWPSVDLREHESWEAFLASPGKPANLHLFTTKAEKGLWQTEFREGDGLLFGNESSGVPSEVHAHEAVARVKIPRFQEDLRSLNLATAAAIATYEALRQIKGAAKR